MNEATVKAILIYYLVAWVGNVGAYLLVSVGLFRWWRFLQGSGGAEHIVRVSFKVTIGFAAARLTAGAFGVTLYELGHLTAIATIFVLGVTSLLLNTTFIMTEGAMLYWEAKKASRMPVEGQEQIRRAAAVFRQLGRTANA